MAVRDAKNPTRTADDSGDRGGGIRGGGNPYRPGGGGSTLDNPGLPREGNVTSKGGYGGSNKEGESSDKPIAPKKSLIDRVLDEFEKARKEGNEANEKRYQEILEDFDQLATDQQDRLTELDKRFGGVAEELMETSGDVGKKIKDIASGAIGVATDKGEKRISDIGGRYDRAGTKLGDLSDKARRQMGEAGEAERKGVLGRAGEALGRLRGDYDKLADKSDVRRGEAGEDIRGGFEGQQAEQRGGFKAAREDVAGLYGEGRERVRSDYDRGVSEAGERFRGGRGDVGEGYREAGERAGDIGGGLADRISGMSAKSLRDLVSSAEGRLGDLGEGFRDVGRGQEERIARSRGEAGEIIGGERERQQGEFARGGAESEGRFGRGRERVREEYERGAEEAGGRYAERGEEGRSLLRGLGDAARGRISRDFDTARTKRLGAIEQDMVRRGLGNTTIRSGARREAQSELDRNQQEAEGRLDEQLRREQAGAYERYSGAEEQARDRLQAGGLGAGAQLTGAELGAQEGRESQRAARSGQLGQTAIGADLAAAQRGEAAAQQAGMAGAGQDIAGQTQISQLEQLLGREGLGRTIGALSQGAGTQLGLLGQGAGAGANVTGAGLSAQQNLANQGLAAGTGMTQGQISALQQLIGNQLGAQQQTALTGLGTQAQMAGQRSAAGENLGLAGLGQQAAGNQALLGADRGIGGQALAAGLGQSAQNVGQQAALAGQGLGEQGAAERQLTGLEGQGAFQGAGAGYGNLSQQQSLLAQLRANQLAAQESGNIGLTGTQLAESGVKERKFENVPSLQDAAALALGFGAAGGGVNMGGGMLGGGGMPSTGGGFANVEDTISLKDKPKPVSDDKEGGDGKTPMEKIRDAVGGEGEGFDIPGGGGPGSAGPGMETVYDADGNPVIRPSGFDDDKFTGTGSDGTVWKDGKVVQKRGYNGTLIDLDSNGNPVKRTNRDGSVDVIGTDGRWTPSAGEQPQPGGVPPAVSQPGGDTTAPPVDPLAPDPTAPKYPHSKVLPDGTQVFSQPDGTYSPERPTTDKEGNPIPPDQSIPVHGGPSGPPVQDGEQPGTEQPGTEQPGTEKPGTEKPGGEFEPRDDEEKQRSNEYYGDWQERIRQKRHGEKMKEKNAAIEADRERLKGLGMTDEQIDNMKYDPMKGDRDPNVVDPNTTGPKEGEVLGPDGRPMIYDEIGDRWTAASDVNPPSDPYKDTRDPNAPWTPENPVGWADEKHEWGPGGYPAWMEAQVNQGINEGIPPRLGSRGSRGGAGSPQGPDVSTMDTLTAGRDAVYQGTGDAAGFLFDPTLTETGNTGAADWLRDTFENQPEPVPANPWTQMYPGPQQGGGDTVPWQGDRNEMTHPAMYPGDNVGGGMGFGGGSEGGIQGGGGGFAAGGGGGFESDFTGRVAPGGGFDRGAVTGTGGYVNPSSQAGILPTGGTPPQLADVAKKAADNQWEGWDFAKQGTQQAGSGSSFKPIPQLAGNEPIGTGGGFPAGLSTMQTGGGALRDWGDGSESRLPPGYDREGNRIGEYTGQTGGGYPAPSGALRDLAGEAADAAQFGGSWQNGTWQPSQVSMPMAPNQPSARSGGPAVIPKGFNDTPAPFTGLKNLATVSKKAPVKKSPQTYRPTQVGVYT